MATQKSPPAAAAGAKRGGKRTLTLGLGALGVVFGDIGTSPLYAFQDIFSGTHPIPAFEHRVMGAASTVFWTLTLVVSIKYVLIVMRADNDGEGGVMALSALAARAVRNKRGLGTVLVLGIAGASLFYGDGMITPAISVLSAVEGIEVFEPSLTSWVLPIAIVVLILLFLVQRHGTARIGRVFGPVMLLWFFLIGLFGLLSVLKTPHVLESVNPGYAYNFASSEPAIAFLALGSVVLCVTGAEALYADMGQFGRGPIRLSWFAIATPALYLTYFGQAALIIRDHAAASNPFYLLVPKPLLLPMVVLATLATVIASQAVISGAFSMTRQAIHLGYLPTMTARHTSHSERGQVYVPAVNWTLMIAVLILVVTFRTSANLSSAYGIAVTGTFVITTMLMSVVALKRWKISPWIVLPVATFFGFIDLSFFLSNLTKFDTGGWFPLAVAAVIFALLTTWRAGRTLTISRMGAKTPSLTEFVERTRESRITATSGTAVYLMPGPDITPYALVEQVKRLGVISENVIVANVQVVDRPWVDDSERLSMVVHAPGLTEVTSLLGFMERPDVTKLMVLISEAGVAVDPATCTYVLHVVSILVSKHAPMWMPRQRLYAAMHRMVVDPLVTQYLPVEQVLEVGTVVRL